MLMWGELQLSNVLGREGVSFGTFVNVLISFVIFIRMSGRGRHGGRCGGLRRHEVSLSNEILALEEGIS